MTIKQLNYFIIIGLCLFLSACNLLNQNETQNTIISGSQALFLGEGFDFTSQQVTDSDDNSSDIKFVNALSPKLTFEEWAYEENSPFESVTSANTTPSDSVKIDNYLLFDWATVSEDNNSDQTVYVVKTSDSTYAKIQYNGHKYDLPDNWEELSEMELLQLIPDIIYIEFDWVYNTSGSENFE